jgi:hypothetical protein
LNSGSVYLEKEESLKRFARLVESLAHRRSRGVVEPNVWMRRLPLGKGGGCSIQTTFRPFTRLNVRIPQGIHATVNQIRFDWATVNLPK